MYFATNLPEATLPTKIAQEFEGLREAPQIGVVHLFALVDCAFDEGFLDKRYGRALPPKSLYDDTVLQPFGPAAPHVLTAPEGKGEPAAWLNYLFSVCGNKPMLSIIASSLNAEELALHMGPYLIAITPDKIEWPVRWGDTRVLPMLLDALTETQRGHFLGPVRRWWSPGRDGKVLRWDGAAQERTAATFDKLPLSDKAFGSLVDSAEADAILTQIEDRQPDVLRRISRAECHATVRRHLILASANGIEAAHARRHFSVLALVLKDDFSLHPEMASLLQRTRAGADYGVEVASLSPEFWLANEMS